MKQKIDKILKEQIEHLSFKSESQILSAQEVQALEGLLKILKESKTMDFEVDETPEEFKDLPQEQINNILKTKFSYD